MLRHSDRATLRRLLVLARWLGPWSDDSIAPEGVDREEIHFGSSARPLRGWLYEPKKSAIDGSVLVIPGLHHLGPADPRLDRFCRVLARAGRRVLCPFLPSFEALLVSDTIGPDAIDAFDAIDARAPQGTTPGVFSISFGSRAALDVALARHDRVQSLILFGGYSSWQDAMRFALVGRDDRPFDPLNRPVVFLNLLDQLRVPNKELVAKAIRQQVHGTWGRTEMREASALKRHAEKIADSLALPREERLLFLQSAGVEFGGEARAFEALGRIGRERAYLDPAETAGKVQVPVVVAHGRDDDVIPVEHATELAAMIPGAEAYVTGTYAHTGKTEPEPFDLAATQKEYSTMFELLWHMSRIGCAT